MFIPDSSRPATEASRKRAERRAREANFDYADPADRPNNLPPKKARAGIKLDPADAIRLKLRQHQRKIWDGNGPAPTQLTTLANVHAFDFATRYLDGGRSRLIECIQLAVLERLPEATAWWMVYADLLPSERQSVSLDDICAATGVRPSRLMAEVVSTMMEHGRDVANLIAAMTHPKVFEAAALSAQRIDGPHADIALKDRHALLQTSGHMPVQKGGTVINVHASANAKAASAAASEPSVPSFTSTMTRVREVVTARTAGQLSAASSDLDLPFLNAGAGARAAQPPVEAELMPPSDDEA